MHLTELAEGFISDFPRQELPEFESGRNFKDWIVESHQLARDFIYAEIEYDTEPTKEYLTKSYELIKRRIALGGYRLSDLILKYFADGNSKFLE